MARTYRFWIPHTFGILPFFRLPLVERIEFLDAVPATGHVLPDSNEPLAIGIEYNPEDVRDDSLTALLRITYNLNGNMTEWTARIKLEDSGMTTISILSQVSSEDARYVAKNIASVLRELFSPLYADSRVWNDRFGISSHEDRNEAIRDMADQMVHVSEDNIMLIQSWSNKRVDNHYSMSAENIVSEEGSRNSKDLDTTLRIKAHANLLNAVSVVDAFIDDRWRIALSYLQACRWFASVFGLGDPIQTVLHQHLELAASAYETASRQRRSDYDAFGADARPWPPSRWRTCREGRWTAWTACRSRSWG